MPRVDVLKSQELFGSLSHWWRQVKPDHLPIIGDRANSEAIGEGDVPRFSSLRGDNASAVKRDDAVALGFTLDVCFTTPLIHHLRQATVQTERFALPVDGIEVKKAVRVKGLSPESGFTSMTSSR